MWYYTYLRWNLRRFISRVKWNDHTHKRDTIIHEVFPLFLSLITLALTHIRRTGARTCQPQSESQIIRISIHESHLLGGSIHRVLFSFALVETISFSRVIGGITISGRNAIGFVEVAGREVRSPTLRLERSLERDAWAREEAVSRSRSKIWHA